MSEPATTGEKIDIETRDGVCPSHVFHPAGAGPWPGVLLFMDGIGVRPALHEVASRIAGRGYFVLVPDLFYRSGPYAPMDARTVFADPAQRKVLMETFMSHVTPANMAADTAAFLDCLGAEARVKRGGVATTGYCMGGSISLRAAGGHPARVAAAASFHGSRLATDAPDSPHLLAPKMKARVYVAGAVEDQGFPDDMKARLAGALASAGVAYAVETYPAKHGWVFRDTPAYDAACSERHFEALFALLASTLG